MGDLSPNFNRAEFACKCGCGFDTVDHELILLLEAIRAQFKKSITVNSGCRCLKHNASISGSPRSKHLIGRAADINVKDTDPADVFEFVDGAAGAKFGIGKYSTFTHVDTRLTKARWG